MDRHKMRRLVAGIVVLAGISAPSGGRRATAQDAAPPPPAPAPPVPAATPPAEPGPPPMTREAALEARIQQLEAMVQQLAAQQAGTVAPVPAPALVDADGDGVPDVGEGFGTAGGIVPGAGAAFGPGSGPTGVQAGIGPTMTGGPNVGDIRPNQPAPSTNPNATYRNSTGPLAPGQGIPANPAPSERFEMPARSYNFPTRSRFGPGFEWRSEDDEYVLQFHNLTQVDYRGFLQGGQQPVHDSFSVPRQWFMFSGRLEKPYEYFVSIQNSFDTVNMLDVFLNVHWDDRLQFKFGRFKTPFTYEFYALPVQGLIQPERSLFFNNFAPNRQVGFQAWGQLFDKRLDWAAGIFNQARNSYLDVADGKEFLAFLNWKPFGKWIDSPLENLSLGGSVSYSDGSNPPLPQSLRTQVPTSGNTIVGVPFLTFNNNAREYGPRALWSAHAAWYYNHLSLISEYEGGYQSYALSNTLNNRSRIPVNSWYVQAGYFITGEKVSFRNVVRPLRNFDLRPGFRGPGAIELALRYNYLELGNQVFTGGFADRNQWSNSVYITDVGVNWFWTQTILWRFNWEHAGFGSPVVFAPGRQQLTSDTFWLRCQLFF